MKYNVKLGAIVFEGSQFNVYKKYIRMADGLSREVETAACRDVVRVYPVDDSDQILLIQEYHYTLETDILRTVAGSVNDNESPHDAAQRELQEEIGIEAEHLECFSTSRPILKVDCIVHHFLATGLRKKPRQVNEGELIMVEKIPVAEIIKIVNENRVYEDVIALNLLRLDKKLNCRNR